MGILSNSESLTLSDQCLASAANDKVVVTYVKGDEYDTAEITAGVSAITLSSCNLLNNSLLRKPLTLFLIDIIKAFCNYLYFSFSSYKNYVMLICFIIFFENFRKETLVWPLIHLLVICLLVEIVKLLIFGT